MSAVSSRPVLSHTTVDVVIPVLNEAHVLATSIAKLRAHLRKSFPYRWRVVIADNGSTDGTLQIAEQLAAQHPDVGCVHLDQRGRGRALRLAWTQSTADVVCYMDVDLSTGLEALGPTMKALTVDGYDVAVGSRLMRASKISRCFKREVISRVYNVLVKALLATHFSDAQCGFKAVTRKVVERVVPQVKDQSWFFDTELLVLCEREGYRIKDIPVRWVEDLDSRVKIVRTAWDDIKGIVRVRRHLWSQEFARAVLLHSKKASASEPAVATVPAAAGAKKLMSASG